MHTPVSPIQLCSVYRASSAERSAMGRGLLLFSLGGALGVALGSTPLIGGACNGIEKHLGAGFQRGQDNFSLWVRRTSVRTDELLPIDVYSSE